MPVEAAAGGERVLILSPVFNDWEGADRLVHELDALDHDFSLQVLFVDDGSSLPPEPLAAEPLRRIERVSTLALNRNVGHQRAIAVGLAFAHRNLEFDAVVVMDSDGEDDPRDVARLVEAWRASDGRRLVFAERRRRSEGLAFRILYRMYLATFLALTGFVERTGNFSIIPRRLVQRLVSASELWMHYSSSVTRLRVPFAKVSTDRGVRYRGRPQMNKTAQVIHGLQAISVHREIVAVRVFFFCLVAALLLGTAMATVVAIRVFTDLAIPGWATNVTGFLLILLGQIMSMGLFAIFLVLGSRSTMEVIPLRDYAAFVQDCEVLRTRASAAAGAHGSD